jgi:6-pyruvoyl tetrahydropterin synthase/QueD family protein
MYSVTKSIDIDFAHHIRGHIGMCANVHGHTWKFQVCLSSDTLDKQGFVVDFSELKSRILIPVHNLLDHSFAIGQETYDEVKEHLTNLGIFLTRSRDVVHGKGKPWIPNKYVDNMNGAKSVSCGGIKIALFPFSPTSERLAKWFYEFARQEATNMGGCRVDYVRVYETLSPVEAFAEYREAETIWQTYIKTT